MIIGTITASDFTTQELKYTGSLTNIGIQSGRLFAEISGSFIASLPLTKGGVYRVAATGIEGQSDINLLCIFEDYLFTASGTDYIDGDGVVHTGIAVLNNRFQFSIVSEL